MSYAVRKDVKGWRSVASKKDCSESEVWQENQPELVIVEVAEIIDPVEKLRNFLAANPDVTEIL